MRQVPALATAALLVVVAGAMVLVDTAFPPDPSAAEPVETRVEVSSGAWYCAVGSTAVNDHTRVVAAAPGAADGSGDVRIDTFTDGAVSRGAEREVFTSSAVAEPVPPDLGTVGVMSRWWRTPVAVSRIWERETAGAPRGTAVGPCQPEPSARWYIPGVSTAGGAEAHVVLANPFDTDASVSVSLGTPEGPLEPELLRNVVVPKRSVRDVVLNDHAPERPDLGVSVTTRSGRVIAEGYQTLSPAVGGVEAVTLAQAAPSAATAWTVPWFADRPDEMASWLWVLNVGDGPASLTLTLHTATGGAVPEGLEEVTVPAGHVGRIDLAGVLAEGVGEGGVTVRSDNGQPVVVAAATRAATPGRTGMSLHLGVPEPDGVWVLAGGATVGRIHRLELVNPGASPAEVGVALWGPGGLVTPEPLQAVTVPPGGAVTTDVDGHLPETDYHAVFVTASSGAVVAAYRIFDAAGQLDLAVAAGVPGRQWVRTVRLPQVRFAPGLAERVGSRLLPTPPADGLDGDPDAILDGVTESPGGDLPSP